MSFNQANDYSWLLKYSGQNVCMILNESNQYRSNGVPKKVFLMLESNSFKSDRNRIGCWASIYTNLSELHCKNQLKPDQHARFDLTFTLDPSASSCRENVVKRLNTVDGNVANINHLRLSRVFNARKMFVVTVMVEV